VNYDNSLVVTITVTCNVWAPSNGDHLFSCGAISKPPHRAQSGTTHSGSVYSASLGKTVLGLFCLHLNTIGWNGHVQECSARKEVWEHRSHAK